MIQKFTVSRDDSIYEAWPDVVLTRSGKLVCIFSECTHHKDRSYTRIMLTDSTDRGRTWSLKRPLSEPTRDVPYWNCARIVQLGDGRLVALCDLIRTKVGERDARVHLWTSEDDGESWTGPVPTRAAGIVPDKLLELPSGRWIIACHEKDLDFGFLVQRLWYSDDQGKSWQGPVAVGRVKGLNLCEASILPVGKALVCFMRENSGEGWDCYKAVSLNEGLSWSDPVRFPLPGCHRPVAGHLREGWIMITHRFMQGGKGWTGWWTQNLFAALTDAESALAPARREAHTRILPIDFDRSPASDTGYSGWVQFDDGEIYIVNYILDDAPKGQIRGYSLRLEDFLLPPARP